MSSNTPDTLLKLAADLTKLGSELAALAGKLAGAANTLAEEAANIAQDNAKPWGVDVQVAVRAGRYIGGTGTVGAATSGSVVEVKK